MISRFRVCTAAFAAGILVSTAALATPGEMAGHMDPNAPKYDTPECREARVAAASFSDDQMRAAILAAQLGYAFGIMGAIAGASAEASEARREELFAEKFVERCGEEAFMPYYTSEAESGDDNAAAWLGRAYAHKENWEQSLRWYQAAAAHKNSAAELALGTIYLQGNGVTADRAQAAAWWQKAAGHDSPEANRRLGELYAQDQDYAKAVGYYVEAARHRDGPAALALAQMYEQGAGVVHSDRQAFGWYSMATLAQIPDAEAHRGAVAGRLKRDDIDDLIHEVERCYRNRRCNFD